MLLNIGIGVAEIDFAGVAHVGEGIQHVGELVDGQLLRLEVSTIDSLEKSDMLSLTGQRTNPVYKVSDRAIPLTSTSSELAGLVRDNGSLC